MKPKIHIASCSYGFKYGKTVQEIDERIDAINNQGSLFD